MPKDLQRWLNHHALDWKMPGQAHQLDHSGMWHRGEAGEYAECGTFLAAGFIRSSCGKGFRRQNPFGKVVGYQNLCPVCFRAEVPVLREIKDALDSAKIP